MLHNSWKGTNSRPPLAERLKLWKHRLPTSRTINPNHHGFEAYSYCVMLLGLGHHPTHGLPVLDYMRDDVALSAFDQIRQRTNYLTSTLPPLYKYLVSRYTQNVSDLAAQAV